MEQGNFSTNNAGYFPDSHHSQQIPNASPQRMSIPTMQEIRPTSSSLGSPGLGIAFATNQPPPYQAVRQPSLPGMTSTFSQRLQSTFAEEKFPVQHTYQNTQVPYNQSYNVAIPASPVRGNTQNIFTGSPGNVNFEQVGGVHNLSPGTALGMPRKSLAGMMSPIRPQIPHSNMPPPSPILSVGGRIPGPQSPLLMSAQSPQRRPQVLAGHAQSIPHGHPPQSPVYQHQQMVYAYSPQSAQPSQYSPQSSPVATSPRYMAPAQHSQLSPLVQSPGHLHSPQPMHMPGVQVSRSPYMAARQLSMTLSPTKVQHLDASGSQHWQNARAAQSASQKMWESSADASLVPSLPVLSADTLDLLSTLTVSTVTSPVQSSMIPSMTEARVQKSPLLQKHLLMPAPSIRTHNVPQEGELVKTLTPAEAGSESTVEMQSPNIATPPSRSNLKHGVRPTLTQNTKEDINLENIVLSTCTVTTLYSSSIVTTAVNRENNEKLDTREDISTGLVSEPMQVSMSDVNLTIRPNVSINMSNLEVRAPTSQQSTSDVNSAVESMVTECPSSTGQLPPEILEKRAKLCEIQRAKLKEKLELYKECLTELFFLQNGGNCMDFIQFKKRPSSKLLEYLNKKMPEDRLRKRTSIRRISHESVVSNGDPKSPASDISNASSKKVSSDDGKRIELRRLSYENTDKILQPKVIQQSVIDTGLLRTRSRSRDEVTTAATTAVVPSHNLPKTVMSPQLHVVLPSTQMPKGQLSPLRSKRLSRQNVPVSLDETIGSQEEILERAKQEAVIQRKVVELRKQGLWTQRRLPKVQEPSRNKTHWDYLLEEMRWLATDFAQERKWKRAAARKLVRTVNAYHKEQHDRVRRAEREEQNRLRRIASTMAREIRIFWGNIGKVVEYKQRSLLDEKRQKALDLHLSFIVDQTEKYSDWLSQGLNQTSVASSPTRSLNSSKPGSDDEFLPQGESSDDEETIAVAEQELEKSDNCEDEISLLHQESQLPFDELINSLPAEVIQNIGKPLNEPETEKTDTTMDSKEEVQSPDVKSADNLGSDGENSESCEEGGSKPSPIALRRSARKRRVESETSASKEDPEPAKKQKVDQDANDEEFQAEQDSDEDDEATVEEEEKKEHVDHAKEIEDLQAESEMPIEELMMMYGDAFNQDPDQEDHVSEDENDDQEDEPTAKEESSSEGSDEDENEMEAEEEEIGMDYLFKADLTKDDNMPMIVPADSPKKEEKKPTEGEGSPNKEITDVAAEAASLQPTGFTLATTQVVTPIPSLLKHTLREYQHIGLDWLVTMYDKRLNGILADEMGLGKTIQTIALLAHLACEKGVWGPHLIVVPTSVMLNWEMEFKKWCPGFKILTYYGSQKERKAKRTGWTKSNAFHVCITSYKLVLQDNVSFRRKKWKYLVLDEAQNIKNFKSQRWQTLLNFNSQRRLLLTGTPLQNNLMELWSLMHFLMPHVFQSHKEFKEWFSNPLTGMIEGSQEYNEKLVRRLHKVLRPFLLRRIKKDVEKQMPNKYEHVVRCHLSKRQRFLYEDFMSRASTKDTLDSGHFMSVINILMQLRKVCNHPNLFESRPIVSPFLSDCIDFHAPSLITKVFEKNPFEALNLQDYHLHLPSLTNMSQYQAERIRQLQAPKKLIEELGDYASETSEQDSSQAAKTQIVREQLGHLLKERERLRTRNAAVLNLPQQTGLQPVLTLPISSGTGTLQLTTSAGTTIFPSRVLTIPQSKSEDSTTSQGFMLQCQTPQGTRLTIPNRQIRQLPGGVVQIMTPTTKATNVTGQSSQGMTSTLNGTAEVSGSTVSMDVENNGAGGKYEKLEFEEPTTYVERLQQILVNEQKQRLLRMVSLNEMHCRATPEWLPCDTIDHLKNIYRRPSKNINSGTISLESDAMGDFLTSNSTIIKEMKPITDRFIFHIPKAVAQTVDFHVSHPSPSRYLSEMTQRENLEIALKKEVAPLHFINQAMKIQFPEARLIQYDCGKLQVLDVLLRRFWREKHKCLIFTQMTKVLDVLEAFLSYHGYRYLRLDGSTRVEQRMLLMERFNNDPRIFCFILSTRSGGVGVNLTGADTVIFYDSDWNPTMDAQAQDRCHRIGQTRDVNIYRLISERTVEENILKKANQKRLLGDLAIEGGSFTTAFFKEQAIKDLFNEPSGLEDLATSSDQTKDEKPPQVLSRPITARQKAIAAAKELEAKGEVGDESSSKMPAMKDSASNWEDALQQTEDKEDVDAARQLKEEQDADMEEFTENAEGDEATEVSRVQEEMKSLYEELTPIEKYALKYLEETTEEINKEELELADEEVEKSKQDWEISHLMALKEEEERRLEEEEDEIFYTRDDAENQIYIDDVTGETMSLWFPPTPPQDENDIYIDPIACLLYLPHAMSEEQLPPIQVKRERKRTKTESESPGGASHPKRKMSRSEFHAPRSLFDRPLLKKRDMKASKYRPHVKKGPISPILSQPAAAFVDKKNITAPTSTEPSAVTSTAETTTSETSFTKNPEWLVNEDWKLLQAIQQVLEMPLSLAVLMPAHTPNWDLVADIVNSVCSVYRSPKMCKQRFENVIGPREEDRSTGDISLKKLKGTKTPTKPKPSKLQKTMNQHSLDNNTQHTALYTNRFDVIMETSTKRSTPLKSSSSGQFQRNPKHTSILLENGITYDKPLPPIQVATLRADRIAREKQALEVAKQQQLVQTQAIQQHPTNISQLTATQVAKPAGISTLSQLTAIPLSGGANNIIVNSSTLSALTKKMNQQSGGMVQFSGKTSKVTLSNTALQQTLLRTASGSDQQQTIQHQPQIQIQQQSQVGTMVTVSVLQRLSSTGTPTTAVSNNNTITLSTLRPPITVPTGAIQQGSQQIPKQMAKLQQQQRIQQQQLQLQKQQKKPIKAHITPQKLQITPETMKRLRQSQQLEVAGKQRKTLTPQELEQLLKNPNIRRQIQKPQTAQVQIAPVHAQVQAQQVQEAAAQQAAQHIVTSKPLPITVSVSNLVSVTAVNLAGMNMSIASTSVAGSGQAKTITGQQLMQQRFIQNQLLKQRLASQQQQQNRQGQVLTSKVGVKQTVYAMVAAPTLPQTKRRVNVTASTAGALVGQQQSGTQQPVQLTVTKLLQSQAVPGQCATQIKQQPMAQQGTITQIQQPQMVTQQQVATATILPSSNVGQAQRLITSQRNVMSVQQLVSNQQMILTSAPSASSASSQQFLQRQNPNVVASVSLAAAGNALTSPTQQQQLQNLLMPQVVRAQSQVSVPSQTMRPAIPQQLVLSQVSPQQTLSVSPQTAIMPQANPAAPTTMTLAPSLVQLPVTVAGPQGQAMMVQAQMSDGSAQSQQQSTTASVQYVTRTMPKQ